MAEKMLNDDIRGQVVEILASMQQPVEVLFFGSQDSSCEYCGETEQLLKEIAELSDQIGLQSHDFEAEGDLARQYGVDKVPGFVIAARDGDQIVDYGIRYAGIPAGHEFTSLINDLLIVSQRKSGLSEETRQFLAELDQPVHLQVFVTPTCPYCPRSVVLAHQFAFESDKVVAEMVEAMEFPDLADQYGVSGVPHTSINYGAGEVIGAAPEAQLLEEIRSALKQGQPAKTR
ncbi:MAG TPA: thioredoxin family protein [Anaerolineaceae bacterium]|nr:thioredoxin family protein [Anaerolineaceae bacterium]